VTSRTFRKAGGGDPQRGDSGDKARSEEGATPVIRLTPASPYELNTPIDLESIMEEDALAAESFLKLRTILASGAVGVTNVLVVSSPLPSDGKSFVSLQLARSMAENPEMRTLLIDADMRRPTIINSLSPKPSSGFAEVLHGRVSVERAIIRPKNSRLSLLPTTSASKEPATLLSSVAFGKMLERLRESFDRIIIDTPPLALFPDADIIGGHADGLILVVRSGETPVKAVRRAMESVNSSKVVGVVLNGAPRNLADSYHGDSQYGHYYSQYYSKPRE
jgi:capsular exopolysaccharide synthesis family protein